LKENLAHMKKTIACVLALVIVATAAGAQDPAFDVASVKVVGMGPTYRLTSGSHRLFPPGEASFSETRLRMIVGAAFEVPPQWQELRIVWPERLEPLRMGPKFDIQAKGDPRHGTPAMLRTLWKERFGFAFRRETASAKCASIRGSTCVPLPGPSRSSSRRWRCRA
jgi:hypothetical protein